MVTDDVANKSGVVAVPAAAKLDSLDLEVIYRRTDWNDAAIQTRLRRAEKYEILVPDAVLSEYILNPNG